MIGPVLRYPTNDAGTVLSSVEHLEGIFVASPNGGTSRWKATFDYPNQLMQLKGRTEASMTWKGCFAIDRDHEWAELRLRANDIRFVEIVIGNIAWTTTTDAWLRHGWDDETKNGPRRLLAKKWWVPIDYS